MSPATRMTLYYKMHEITINKGPDSGAVPGDKYLKVSVPDERVYGQLQALKMLRAS